MEIDAGASDRAAPSDVRTVVVPLDDRHTVDDLLHIAMATLPEVRGRVVGLLVSVDDRESEQLSEESESIQERVERFTAPEGVEISFVRREASTISRGILDAVGEIGADLVLLEIPSNTTGRHHLGSVAENVVEVAACRVILYRAGQERSTPARVVLDADGSAASIAAAGVAVRIGQALEIPVEAVAVGRANQARSVALAPISRTLTGVEGGAVRRRLVDSSVKPLGFIGELEATDLAVSGAERADVASTRWSVSSSGRLLRRAPGPVVVVTRQDMSTGWRGRMRARLRSLRPALTELERETIVSRAEAGSSVTPDFVILVTVAALLASFGLLQNSAAVVIGAMLVAPFLAPLSATAVGLVTGRLEIGLRASATLLAGSALALGWAFVAGIVVPLDSPTAEMLARGSPSFLDATVAMAAGVVGAYATARKDIPAALAGVAIAAALVPPVCTAGLALAFGDRSLAGGALLLFVTNVVAMIVLGLAVFWWLGMRSDPHLSSAKVRSTSGAVIAIITLVVVFAMLRVTQQASQASLAAGDLRALFPDAEVVSVTSVGASPITVTAVVRTSHDITEADVARVERRLEDEFGLDLDLEVVVEQVVRAG